MTKIILTVSCQEHCSVWAPGGAPRRQERGACYFPLRLGLVICDTAAWQSHAHQESFLNLLPCRQVQAALCSSPQHTAWRRRDFIQTLYPHCRVLCLSHTTETNSGAPLLMDFRANLDLKSTGKNSLFLPITEDKDVHGKRRPQHKRPDGKNCNWKLGKEVPLTDTALYKRYLSRRKNSKHCLSSLLTETFLNRPCNSALVKCWWL